MKPESKFARAMARGSVGTLPYLLLAASASATTLPPELVEAVKAFDAAQLHGDAAVLNSMLADDYLLLNSDGSEEDREAFIRDYSDPSFKLEPFVIEHAFVRVWPGGAIVGGATLLSGMSSGRHFARCIRFNDVWSERAGAWKVVFTQVSQPPAGSCDRKF